MFNIKLYQSVSYCKCKSDDDIFRRLIRVFTLLSCLIFGTSQAANNNIFRPLPPETSSLDQYQWHYRSLVIFSPTQSDDNYLQQMRLLENEESGLTERDIIVLSDTLPASKGKLRSKLKPKGFEVILFGKDGGMKIRQEKPISPEKLFSTIDRMPMRRANLK